MSSWPEHSIGELIHKVETRNPRENPDQEFLYVDIAGVENAIGRITQPKRLTGDRAPLRARRVIRGGDVIVATTRPYLNQTALVPLELDNQICSTGFCVLRSNGKVDCRFLYWFTRSKRFLNQIIPKMRGSTYPAISDTDIVESFIPLPPLDEQRRISGQLDAMFDRLRSMKSARRETIATLQSAEASWMESVLSIDGQHPKLRLGEISEVVYGVTKNPGRSAGKSPRPYLRVANVQHGFLDLAEIKYIDVSEAELQRWRLQSGDVLLCEGNSLELVGRAAIFRGEIDDCIHQNHVIRVRPNPKQALSGFVLAYLNSRAGQSYFRRKAKRTTNLATINSTEVREMPIPLPPLSEQEKIVDLLSLAKERVGRIQQEWQELENLLKTTEATLLERAFSGEL